MTSETLFQTILFMNVNSDIILVFAETFKSNRSNHLKQTKAPRKSYEVDIAHIHNFFCVHAPYDNLSRFTSFVRNISCQETKLQR